MAKFVPNHMGPLANFLGPPPAVKWEEVDRTFELEPPKTQILATPLELIIPFGRT